MGKLAETQLETSSMQVEFSTDGFAVKQFHSPIRNPEVSLLEAFRNQRKNCIELCVTLFNFRRLAEFFCSTEFVQLITRPCLFLGNLLCFQPEHSPHLCPGAYRYLGSSAVQQWSCGRVLVEGTDLLSFHHVKTPSSFMGSSTQHMKKSSEQERKTLSSLCSERTKTIDELLIITNKVKDVP